MTVGNCALLGMISSLLGAPLQRYLIFTSGKLQELAESINFNIAFGFIMNLLGWSLCASDFIFDMLIGLVVPNSPGWMCDTEAATVVAQFALVST